MNIYNLEYILHIKQISTIYNPYKMPNKCLYNPMRNVHT